MSRWRLIALAAVLLSFAGFNTVSAQPCPFGGNPIAGPALINTPGCHYLTTNLTTSVATAVLTVVVNDVTVDLNGFTITTPIGDTGILVNAPGINNVVIRNGTISGGDFGVQINALVANVVVENLVLRSQAMTAIDLTGANNSVVRECEISGSLQDAILLSPGFVGAGDALITGNQIFGCGGGIFIDSSRAVTISNNQIADISGGSGIGVQAENAQGILIDGNNITRADSAGILADNSTALRVVDNVVTESGIGIHFLSGVQSSQVLDNLANNNTGSGIAIDGDLNLIQRNSVIQNGDAGIWFEPLSLLNRYGENFGWVNGAAPGACVAIACGAPDVCEEGVNVSFGNNQLPGPC